MDDKKVEAWTMCQMFVRDRLKSPATADFGSVLKGTYQRSSDTVTELGNDTYRCRGWVDAQNAFGAVVRIDFDLAIKDNRDAKQTWSLLRVDRFDQR